MRADEADGGSHGSKAGEDSKAATSRFRSELSSLKLLSLREGWLVRTNSGDSVIESDVLVAEAVMAQLVKQDPPNVIVRAQSARSYPVSTSSQMIRKEPRAPVQVVRE